MKKRLLSNRVRNAILMAILLQSVIFGGKRRSYIRIYE